MPARCCFELVAVAGGKEKKKSSVGLFFPLRAWNAQISYTSAHEVSLRSCCYNKRMLSQPWHHYRPRVKLLRACLNHMMPKISWLGGLQRQKKTSLLKDNYVLSNIVSRLFHLLDREPHGWSPKIGTNPESFEVKIENWGLAIVCPPNLW